MNFSEISLSTKKNSADSGSDYIKNFESIKSFQKLFLKMNAELIEIKRSNSFSPLIFQYKGKLYDDYKKQRNINDKFFNDKNIEKIYRNIVLNNKFVCSKLSCKKKTIVNNCSKARNIKGTIKIYFFNFKINKIINNDYKISNSATKKPSKLFKSKNQNKGFDFEFSKKNFCNYYPQQIEMNFKPSQKPSSYPIQTFLGINKDQKEIGSKEFLDLKEDEFCSENDSYKKIEQTKHQLLNHFLQKDSKINSISIRYRHKNATFIYYK